jgi:hypothetical protein
VWIGSEVSSCNMHGSKKIFHLSANGPFEHMHAVMKKTCENTVDTQGGN